MKPTIASQLLKGTICILILVTTTTINTGHRSARFLCLQFLTTDIIRRAKPMRAPVHRRTHHLFTLNDLPYRSPKMTQTLLLIFQPGLTPKVVFFRTKAQALRSKNWRTFWSKLAKFCFDFCSRAFQPFQLLFRESDPPSLFFASLNVIRS